MDLGKLADLIKRDTLFKETLYLGLGIVFLFVIDLVFHVDLKQIPNYQDLNPIVEILIIVPSAYLLARISCEIGSVVNGLLLFLIKFNWSKDLKRKVVEFHKYVQSDTWKPSEEELKVRSTIEAIEEFKDSTYIREGFEEARKNLLISYCLSGFCIGVMITSALVPIRVPEIYLQVLCPFLIINGLLKEYGTAQSARGLVKIMVRREERSATHNTKK